MVLEYRNRFANPLTRRTLLPVLVLMLFFSATGTQAAMLYKNYVVRYDRGWDILCDPYQIQQGDWVLKIFRQKGEIAHDDFREFLSIFQRLNPQVKDIDRIRPGQVVDIPLKKLTHGNLPGQSSGVVTIPFVLLGNPKEMIKKHTLNYTIRQGDTVSSLIANRFGGRYGNLTYNQGLKLFMAANPHIKDIDRIYAGQKIYMPDPSIRKQAWYDDLFDKAGNLVDRMAGTAEAGSDTPQGQPIAAAPKTATAETESAGPAAEAVSIMGGRLLNKGTCFLPMKQAPDFELDLSRFPMIDLQNGSKVILTTSDRVMNVDLPLVQAYWDHVKVVKVPENASSQEILETVLDAFADAASENRLAFDDGGVSISVSAKWIRSEPSADGSVTRHTCITPIMSASQQTNASIIRYLDQNDIVIKEILTGASATAPSPPPTDRMAAGASIDGSSQRALVESFARLMGFHYSANTSISFPYAGIQVQALSNLLSFGNGKELLIDFGDLYGDAVNAIRDTGLDILQIRVDAGSLDILARLVETAKMVSMRSPVFYGAERSAEFNTAITVNGILISTDSGEKRLVVSGNIPELIETFLLPQGIQLVSIRTTAQK